MKSITEICATLDISTEKGLFILEQSPFAHIPYDLLGKVALVVESSLAWTDALQELAKRYPEMALFYVITDETESLQGLGDIKKANPFKGSSVILIGPIERNRETNCVKSSESSSESSSEKGSNAVAEASENEVSCFDISPLRDVVADLRAPTGYPWDKIQTHESLRRYLLEEVYEVFEAIDTNDEANLREELGDVLLQVVFHARLAEERGLFTIEDVISDITEKMIRRHPHVFETANSRTLGAIMVEWEAIKRKEKPNARKFLLSGIPAGLPSILRAQKMQEKAAKAGFDWDDVESVWEQFFEEIEEFKVEVLQKNLKNAEIEGGDILFSLINLFRWYKISGENALCQTNLKFEQRFNFVEKQVRASGRDWKEFSLTELNEFWEEAKLWEQKHSI